jgi:hypothetical protein
MQDSIKCNMEVRQMPIVRPKAFEDMTIAMFDVEHTTTMDGDHA